ncbi:MAG: hypothetical protein TU35_005960 [Thermoproteus sp. AZ2]|uniref:Uncharacterized protein n=1 Tax=Thermoproteus sp. AZ2 TaxID=1609232 RepID=A0ACC6V198_9CREN
MRALGALRLLSLYIKQRYGRSGLALLILTYLLLALAIGASARAGYLGPAYILQMSSLLLALFIIPSASTGIAMLLRSEADFLFATPASPVAVYLIRVLGDSAIYALVLAAYTAPLIGGGAAYYAASLIAIALVMGSAVTLLSFKPAPQRLAGAAALAAYLVVSAYAYPRADVLYGLISPSPLYASASAAAALIAVYALPLREISRLSTDAYGVLAPAQPERSVRRMRFRDLWSLAWLTTSRGAAAMGAPGGPARVNVFALMVPASVAGALAYLAALPRLPTPQVFLLSSLSFYLLFFAAFSGLTPGLSLERPWISFAVDHYAYIRYRMSARTALTAAAVAPWAAAYAVESLAFRPSIYLAAAAAEIPLVMPAFAWLIGAFWGQPQIREPGMAVRPIRVSARALASSLLALILMALMVAPFVLASYAAADPLYSAIARSMAVYWAASAAVASALFFYLALFSGAGRRLWDWLVNRLSELGYA